MQTLKACLLLCAAALASNAAAETFMGQEVFKQTFTISGGKTVELPMTKMGPPPATTEGVTVMACGPLFGPSKSDPRTLETIWALSAAVPKDSKYQSVAVDDVTGPAEVSLVSARGLSAEPMVFPDGKEFHMLQLRSLGTPITERTTPWLYHDKTDTFVLRLTLQGNNGKPITLYQPCVIPGDAKAKIRDMAQRVADKK